MSSQNPQSVGMQILTHNIYEYNKGLRSFVLHAMSSEEQGRTEELLTSKGVIYYFLKVNPDKVNVFFGDEICIKIIESFGDKSLSDYTDEEDFMLGTMLG